jgi:hypothetical protein
VLTRLAEVMFIEVVRRYLEGWGRARPAWLAELRDELVGRVLGLIHRQPGHPWTLEALANKSPRHGQVMERSPSGGPAADAVPGSGECRSRPISSRGAG